LVFISYVIFSSCSLELCAALVLAFLALDSKAFFRIVLSDPACDEDGEAVCSHSLPRSFSHIFLTLAFTEENLLEDNALCWSVVWKIFPSVDPLDPDKQVSLH